MIPFETHQRYRVGGIGGEPSIAWERAATPLELDWLVGWPPFLSYREVSVLTSCKRHNKMRTDTTRRTDTIAGLMDFNPFGIRARR